jgi:spoIIIJ-associated protein
MKIYQYEGKKIEDIKSKILIELNEKEENLIIIEKENKSGLFKGKKVILNVVLISDVIEYIKEYIKKVTNMMNIEINMEVKKRDENIFFLIYSNQNKILIGRNGKTIDALQTIIRQAIYNQIGTYVNFNIDVGDYKKNQISNIEYLAKKVAADVAKTKIEVKLDSMNSYERRIIHSLLAEDKNVFTQSVGEEPNRCVVIKPKKE